MIEKIDITPPTTIYKAFTNYNYKIDTSISKFIDNSISSFRNNDDFFSEIKKDYLYYFWRIDELNRIGDLSLLARDENQKKFQYFNKYMKKSINFHGTYFDDVLIHDGSGGSSNKFEINKKLRELFESKKEKITLNIRVKFFEIK